MGTQARLLPAMYIIGKSSTIPQASPPADKQIIPEHGALPATLTPRGWDVEADGLPGCAPVTAKSPKLSTRDAARDSSTTVCVATCLLTTPHWVVPSPQCASRAQIAPRRLVGPTVHTNRWQAARVASYDRRAVAVRSGAENLANAPRVVRGEAPQIVVWDWGFYAC